MKFVFNLLLKLACMGSSLLLLFPQASFFASPLKAASPREATELSAQEVRNITQLIAVRIFRTFSEDGRKWKVGGSGFIVKQTQAGKDRDYEYLVLTNNHVVESLKDKYYLQTHDGRTHQALLVKDIQFPGSDLALLKFSSPHKYEKAELGKSATLEDEDKIFAAGFPCDTIFCKGEFTFTAGAVAPKFNQSGKSLIDGYQIGYTNDITQGMSGGPVLNIEAQVVAINGRKKYPIGNPYKYPDGWEPPKEIQSWMRHFAWGIPIERYLEQADKNFVGKPLPTPMPTHNQEEWDSPEAVENSKLEYILQYIRQWITILGLKGIGAILLFLFLFLFLFLVIRMLTTKARQQNPDELGKVQITNKKNEEDNIDIENYSYCIYYRGDKKQANELVEAIREKSIKISKDSKFIIIDDRPQEPKMSKEAQKEEIMKLMEEIKIEQDSSDTKNSQAPILNGSSEAESACEDVETDEVRIAESASGEQSASGQSALGASQIESAIEFSRKGSETLVPPPFLNWDFWRCFIIASGIRSASETGETESDSGASGAMSAEEDLDK